MTTTTTFSFQHRPLVPFAHDYAHGDQEDWHQHDCAQLLHILSGVVRVATPAGYWVVPPGRGVWLPAGTPHALRMTGNVAARTVYRSAGARRSSGGLPDRTDHAAAAGTDRLIPLAERYAPPAATNGFMS
jgi:mannose-6-phosphate isomerase-like protein (cupin superfamily)